MTNLSLSTAAPLALALTLFGGTAVSRTLFSAAQDLGASPAQEGENHEEHDENGEHEHGVLHESMELMQRSLKGLRKMLKKPEMKAEAIALCVTMEAAALEGFLHPPGSPEAPDELEGTELHVYQSDFKKHMLEVAGTLVDLELALEKGDADQAKALYRALGAKKKEGHDVYIK